ncbi:hypothetical protein AB0K14_18705 [Actinosynnema sp. NPDC050801]|uniref:hypothetical protein n=1 Tax=unclassified Actinosynnema TaxID=2637065 RepID=UPI00340044DA
MSEPDPFASPYHRVDLPGQANAPHHHPPAPLPPGYHPPVPMPPVDPRDVGPRRPVTTTVASWCWIAAAVLVVIVLPGLVYTGVDGLTAEILRDSADADDPAARTAAELGARITPALFALAFAVLSVPYLIAAVKLRSGRGWARIVLTVLAMPSAAFGIVMLLVFVSGSMPYVHWGLGVAWSCVFFGICAQGLVAMYLPASNAYTRSVTR